MRCADRRSSLALALSVFIAASSGAAASPPDTVARTPVAEKRRIKTIIVDNYRPYTFLNDRGEPDGFSVEILRAVARTIGLELEIRPDTWEHATKALELGAIDVLPMMAYSGERDRLFDFSAPHTIAYDSVFVRKSSEMPGTPEDLSGKTVIVMRKDIAHQYLVAQGLDKRMNLVLVDSLPEALRRLAAGKADAAIMPKLVGLVLARILGFAESLQSSAMIDSYNRPFSFAVKEGNAQLLSSLNYGLSVIKATGEYEAIYAKWLAVLEDPQIHWKTALEYAVAIAAALLALGAWNLSLRRQVQARTRHLVASQKLLSDISDNSGSLIYALDAAGRFLMINRSLEAVLGVPRETMIGKTRETVLPPATAAEHRANDLRVLAERQTVAFEETCIEPDGMHTYLSVKFPLFAENGATNGVGGVSTDITERKRMEEALRESEEKFRLIARLSPAGVYLTSPSGECSYVNEFWCKIAGLSPEEALGKGWIRGIHPADREKVFAAWEKMIASHGQWGMEYRFHNQAGTSTWVYGVAGTQKDADGNIIGYVGVNVDITERKLTEQALAESELRLRTLVQTIPDLIWLKDPDGVYLDCNAVFERFFGAAKKDIVGKTDYDFVERELADFFREHDRKAMAAGKPSVNEEWVTFADDGHRALLETIKTPMSDAAGRLVGVLGIARDITERIRITEEKTQLENQLRQSQKVEAIGRLAGGVAHDFNTLTAIVLGYGEMLLGELALDDHRHKYAAEIVEAGRRSAALTRQLLAFSRKQTLQPEVLDLNALLRNFAGMLGRLLGENVELTVRLAAVPCCITADPGQIEQVVTNLAVNARDAMPLGGRLALATAVVEFEAGHAPGHQDVIPGRYVRLSLTDTGSGMDKAAMDRLFEPFFTTKPKGKGTGLGLATTFGIVKQSGGYIWASSEPGTGTTFTICLPWTDARPATKAPMADGEKPRGQGERVLVVEDEPGMRELCENLLVRLGYRVITAGNGPDALLLLRARRVEPDLVLTDVIMPGMSGVEMATQLRTDWPGLRVLYMSGYPDEALDPHDVLAPGTPFIQKPFTEQALALKLRETLAGKALTARVGRRVLMIDDDGQFRELVQHFCAKAGHTFLGVDSAPTALAALAAQPYDVLLVDLNIPGTSGAQVLREIRAAGHAAPAIVLTGDVASADMDLLRPLGAVLALEKSSQNQALLQAIETAAGIAGRSGKTGTS